MLFCVHSLCSFRFYIPSKDWMDFVFHLLQPFRIFNSKFPRLNILRQHFGTIPPTFNTRNLLAHFAWILIQRKILHVRHRNRNKQQQHQRWSSITWCLFCNLMRTNNVSCTHTQTHTHTHPAVVAPMVKSTFSSVAFIFFVLFIIHSFGAAFVCVWGASN